MTKFKDIGARLRQLRGPMTQADFAKKLEIALLTYQRYESGQRTPKGDVLHRIAALCNITTDWILSGEQPKEYSNEEIKEFIRQDWWINKIEFTEEEVEQHVSAYRDAMRLKKDYSTVAEHISPYGIDAVTDKILKKLEGMSEEEKRAILKYVEAQKQLIHELKKAEERGRELANQIQEKKPGRPIPIEFTAMERYALRLYEMAEQKGMTHKLDELIERLLNGLEEQPGRKKESG